jgi:hypothetical protein
VETMWFSFLAFMLAMYVVLDGFDLGVGTLHLFLGRSVREREQPTAAIGPTWNGNEVWLIAAGGVIFPRVYDAALSGLYLALILLLWLLVGRGLSLELRNQIAHPLWHQVWWGELALLRALSWPTYAVREEMLTNLLEDPWRLAFPLVAVGALVAVFAFQRRVRWAAPSRRPRCSSPGC